MGAHSNLAFTKKGFWVLLQNIYGKRSVLKRRKTLQSGEEKIITEFTILKGLHTAIKVSLSINLKSGKFISDFTEEAGNAYLQTKLAAEKSL